MILLVYTASHSNHGARSMGVLVYVLLIGGAVAAGLIEIRKSREDFRAMFPPPGSPIDEATRKLRLRYIRSGKITIAALAVVLVFALARGGSAITLAVGALINLGLIAVILQLVARLKRTLD